MDDEDNEESKLIPDRKMTFGAFHDYVDEKLDQFLTDKFNEESNEELPLAEWLEQFQLRLIEE